MRFRRGPAQHSRFARQPVGLGVAGALVLLIGSWFAFTKDLPFVHGHRLDVVVQTAAGLRGGTPVRIAGVDVGKVTDVRGGPGAASTVRVELEDRGLPVHEDATVRIRPRLFLEGGYYLELEPGSPSAPELEDEDTIPLGRTSVPVQMDQALGVLDTSGRTSLRSAIAEMDDALSDGGARDLGATAEPLGRALRDGAVVAEAMRGTQDGDVTRLVTGAARATEALAGRRDELASLVSALATTTGALASEDTALRGTVRELDRTVETAPAALDRVRRALPEADALLAALRPGLRRAVTVLPDVDALLRQLQLAAGDEELGGLVRELRPVARALPQLSDRLSELLPLVTPVTDCVRERLLPVLEAKLDDDHLSTGRPVWQEIAYVLPGMAGSSASFDANGPWVKNVLTAGGDNIVSTGDVPGIGTLVGRAEQPILGVRPQWLGPGKLPAYRPDAACADQPAPDLSARGSGGAPMRTIRAPARKRSAPLTRAGLQRLLEPARLRRLLPEPGAPGRRR